VVPGGVPDHHAFLDRYTEAIRRHDQTRSRWFGRDLWVATDDDFDVDSVMGEDGTRYVLRQQRDDGARSVTQEGVPIIETGHRHGLIDGRELACSNGSIGRCPTVVARECHQDRHGRAGRGIPVGRGHVSAFLIPHESREITERGRVVGVGLQVNERAVEVEQEGLGLRHRPMVHNVAMADNSFDIVSKLDRAEVDNAVNQAAKELAQRFDFKGTGAKVEYKGEMTIELEAETDDRVRAALDVLKDKLVKRGVSLKVLDAGEPRPSGKLHKITCQLKEGITQDQAKKLAKLIRDEGPKKVKTQVQGDELRVSSSSRDDLQEVIAMVKEADLDFPVQFVNYR